MTELIVALDAVALLRESRRGSEPDPAAAAVLAELAGAAGVSVGLRTDRRHAQERDARALRSVVRSELSIRVPPTPEALKAVIPIRPDEVVLVPERSDSLAHDSGFDLASGGTSVSEAAGALREAGLRVLVLVDPEREQVRAGHRLGTGGLVLTGSRLGAARLPEVEARELEAIDECARLCAKLGLRHRVGHGLGLRAARRLGGLPSVPAVEVGHGLLARAMLVGMDRAVRDLVEDLTRSEGGR